MPSLIVVAASPSSDCMGNIHSCSLNLNRWDPMLLVPPRTCFCSFSTSSMIASTSASFNGALWMDVPPLYRPLEDSSGVMGSYENSFSPNANTLLFPDPSPYISTAAFPCIDIPTVCRRSKEMRIERKPNQKQKKAHLTSVHLSTFCLGSRSLLQYITCNLLFLSPFCWGGGEGDLKTSHYHYSRVTTFLSLSLPLPCFHSKPF